jgi:hypothetical protein
VPFRFSIKYILIFFSLLIFTILLFFYRSYAEYEKAYYALERGDVDIAITHFGWSIKWYIPGNPYVKKSIHMLFNLGEQSEERGEDKRALAAYRTVRSSLFASRSFYTPGKSHIAEAEKRIALILLKDKPIASKFGKEFIRKAFRIKTGTHIIWTIIMEIGLIGWVGIVIICILGGGKIRFRHLSFSMIPYGLIIFVVFYSMWIIGMARA